MKRAIVTGGAGLIGAGICQALASEGWQVVSFDKKAAAPGTTGVSVGTYGDPATVRIDCPAGQRAAAEAKRKREALSGAIGSGVSMGTKLGMAAGAPDVAGQAAKDEALKKALGIGAPASGGISSAEAGTALFGAAPAAAGVAAAPAAGMAAASAPVGMTASGTSFSDLDPSVAASLKTGTPGYEDVEQADPNTQYQHFEGAFGGSTRNLPVRMTASEQAPINAAAAAKDAQNLATFNQLDAARPGRGGFSSDIGAARMDANADRMRRSMTAQVGDNSASLSRAVAARQPAPAGPATDLSAGSSEDPTRFSFGYSTDPYAPENLASAIPNTTGRRASRAIRGSR
jgi:NAD(P)-dependent dehydrogenase (short-subunit alcohol dehydrogenase family)